MKLTFTLIVSLLLIVSCEHEPIEPEKVEEESKVICDSNEVYFENDILPIFISSCAFNGCHNASNAAAGLVLTNYDDLIKSDVVREGRPDNSELFERISDTGLIIRMPPGEGNSLPQEDIDKIEKWILDGALNSSCVKQEN